LVPIKDFVFWMNIDHREVAECPEGIFKKGNKMLSWRV